MTASSKGGGGAKSSKAGSSGMPNGAILDDTAEVMAMREQRFKAWAKGYRQKKLKENRTVVHWLGSKEKD